MEWHEAEHYIEMMDMDNSKTLSEAELKNGDPSQDRTVFPDADTNSDGQLSIEEVMALHYPDMSDPKVHLAEVEEEISFILTNLSADHEAADKDFRAIKVGCSHTYINPPPFSHSRSELCTAVLKVGLEEAKQHMEYFVHSVDQFSDTSSIFREL
jgi:hypothetical protein